MKTILTASALIAALTSPALAYDLKAQAPSNCRPTLEAFVKHELGEGRKVIAGDPASDRRITVRWDTGTTEVISFGPQTSGWCIDARQYVSGGVR